jgi:uncharacterized damage-inducible protein DinB
MTAPAIAQLLWLLDEAFAGQAWHALLPNLRATSPGAWTWVPPSGHRSVRGMVQHVGGCKFMYENHAFGDATLTWDHPLVTGEEMSVDLASAISWLREGHDRLRRSVAALTDADLDQPRMTNWGEPKETRWIVAVMIQHDIYHAGEINHVRALHDHDDRWAFDQDD